jgi:hypothetical protein
MLCSHQAVRLPYLLAAFAFLAALIVTLQGCGGGTNSANSQSSSQQDPPVAHLVISTPSLPNGQVGTTYSATLTATGGTAPYIWSVTVGTLPGGLALNSATGAITGTPTQVVSNAPLVFMVTDSSNPKLTQTATLTLSISSSSTAASIALSPTLVTVETGATQQFTATVQNASVAGVTWQVNGVAGGNGAVGTISGSGLYTAPGTIPNPAAVTLTAISQADPTKSASAQVIVVAPVSITTTALPAATVNIAYTEQLTATGGSGVDVWALINPLTGFSLSSSGLLTGTPAGTTSLSFQVKVADATNSANFATANLTLSINSAVSITLSPTLVTLETGASQQFTATVQNTNNTAVTWQVNGITGGNGTAGTISGSGLYTAPGTLPNLSAVRVTAISQTDPAKSASAQVTIVAALSITTTALPVAAVNISYTQQLTAAGGTGTYAWVLTTPVTGFSLSASGLLTGTPTSTTSLSFQFKVADAANSANFATATLTLAINSSSTPVSITLSPTLAAVETGATQQFTATVQNTSNTAVTWQINGITGGNGTVGTVSTSGLYTAPAAVPNPAAVTLAAISQADTTKSASAQMTIVAALSITTTTLPAATLSVAYTQQLTATGGNGSDTWTLTTPVTGFSLSSSGFLTGTPMPSTAPMFLLLFSP